MTSGAQTKVIACCLCQCLVCNGRTTTSAARPRAGDPCEVSSILEKQHGSALAGRGRHRARRRAAAGENAVCWVTKVRLAIRAKPGEPGQQSEPGSQGIAVPNFKALRPS